MKKILSGILVLTMSIGILSGCSFGGDKNGGFESGKGKVVIKVNDVGLKSGFIDRRVEHILKYNQVENKGAIADYYKAQIIKGLISNVLIAQELKKRDIKITDEDFNKRKEEAVKNYGSEKMFEEFLKKYDISKDEFDEMVREQVRQDKMVAELKKDIQVDPEKYYNENKNSFHVSEQVKASHILVKDEAKAKEIIKQLNNGADFVKLAKENSEDPSNKDNGGELGYFTANVMDPAFSKAAFAMKPGETSQEPVKSQFGYHIIKVEDKKEAHQQSYEEVKDQIKDQLINNEVGKKLGELTQELLKNAKIEYLDENYNNEKLMAKAEEAMKAEQAVQQKESNQGQSAPQPTEKK